MKILLLHKNFPAQFVHIAGLLRQSPEHQVVYLTQREDVDMQGVHKVIYSPQRETSPKTHAYLQNAESAVLAGQAAAKAALQLKMQGFKPDIIYGHSGWGSTLYMKQVYPDVPFVGYFEWYYRAHGSDVDFFKPQIDWADEERLRVKNSAILLDLYQSEIGVTPTYWQHSQFPVEYGKKLKVIHDGVDTQWCCPKPGAKLVLPEANLDLSQVEEIITYVGRGMEPYRGFPQFMQAISLLLKKRPKCHVVIVGSEKVFYGSSLPDGKTFKEVMLEKLSLDMSRIHFTGHLPKHRYVEVLQASTVHVYLTVPFVLSWSMLEAMACGCTLVASNTKPVTEVVNDGVNGLLVDFFNPSQLAEVIEEALTNKKLRKALGIRARETICDRYDLQKLLPQHIGLLQQVAQGRG